MVGPVTLGIALIRAGVPEHEAFEVAVRAVRSHVQSLLDIVDAALPGCEQVVFIDEPSMGRLAEPGFPLAPDTAIDLVSGALAAIEPRAVSGLHCCADADWASLISAGPQILAVPVSPAVAFSSGYLHQFLGRGGIIAWGVVPTDGPIPMSAERPWRQLTELWCQMVQRGCDQVQLRQQSHGDAGVRPRHARAVGRGAGPRHHRRDRPARPRPGHGDPLRARCVSREPPGARRRR